MFSADMRVPSKHVLLSQAWVAVFVTLIALFAIMVSLTLYVGKVAKGGKQVRVSAAPSLRP